MTSPFFIPIPADRYNFEQLANIYNESRVDYIVPMPMNAKRMADYATQYAVDLAASVVAINKEQQIAGLGMLGVRGERAWITRLGVIPTRRGRGIGQFLMSKLLENAVSRGCIHAQLEVIEGNEPARTLFSKLGFIETRRFLVLRRPPGNPPDFAFPVTVEPLNHLEIETYLVHRCDHPSWLDETPSLLAGGAVAVEGVRVIQESGETGWGVFRPTTFQLSHVTMGAHEQGGALSAELALAILTAIHHKHPRRDTKVENVPENSPLLEAFGQIGYMTEFARIEMGLRM